MSDAPPRFCSHSCVRLIQGSVLQATLTACQRPSSSPAAPTLESTAECQRHVALSPCYITCHYPQVCCGSYWMRENSSNISLHAYCPGEAVEPLGLLRFRGTVVEKHSYRTLQCFMQFCCLAALLIEVQPSHFG